MTHGAESQQEQQEAADTTDQTQASGRWQPPAASDSEESEDGKPLHSSLLPRAVHLTIPMSLLGRDVADRACGATALHLISCAVWCCIHSRQSKINTCKGISDYRPCSVCASIRMLEATANEGNRQYDACMHHLTDWVLGQAHFRIYASYVAAHPVCIVDASCMPYLPDLLVMSLLPQSILLFLDAFWTQMCQLADICRHQIADAQLFGPGHQPAAPGPCWASDMCTQSLPYLAWHLKASACLLV